jgi:archaellin
MVILGWVVAKDTNDDGNVDEIVFIVSNSLEGAAINLTTTTDSDSDGVLSDESTKVHSTIVSYVEKVQKVTDLAWTQSEIGKGDGDSLLEPNEKFEITIDISQLSTRLGADDEFTLEMEPELGSSLVIQRRRLR